MNKQMAISYGISDFPADFDPANDKFEIKPFVELLKNYNQKSGLGEFKEIYSPGSIKMEKRPQLIEDIFRDKNDFYKKLQKNYRANQERIISDLICGIILQELRNEKDDRVKLIFYITSKFSTDKIVGRLAYLNLPMDRIIILFVSRNLTDFYTRNIVFPFGRNVDLNYLNEHNEDDLFGPFPDDGTIGLLRTFYRTYDKVDNIFFYPARADLFCQCLNKEDISNIKEQIISDYLSRENTETVDVFGLKKIGDGQTRIPNILNACEDRVKLLTEMI